MDEVTEKKQLKLVLYACSQPNLSYAEQIKILEKLEPNDCEILEKYHDKNPRNRAAFSAALDYSRESNCDGMLVYGLTILTYALPDSECAAVLNNFLGSHIAIKLFDRKLEQIPTDQILALRNNAFYRMQQGL